MWPIHAVVTNVYITPNYIWYLIILLFKKIRSFSRRKKIIIHDECTGVIFECISTDIPEINYFGTQYFSFYFKKERIPGFRIKCGMTERECAE